jgi:hypothetical protein
MPIAITALVERRWNSMRGISAQEVDALINDLAAIINNL